MSIEAAAIAYYEARVVRRNAKAALLAFRQECGGCEGGICYGEDGEYINPCYTAFRDEPARWCEVCTASQPLYEARKRAAHEVGKALRRLVYVCGKQAGGQS